MDFERTALCDKAKEELARVERTHSIAELRRVVDAAIAVGLEDPKLEPLQEMRQRLDVALEALRQAMRQDDVVALRRCLQRSEDAGLPDWDAESHGKASELLTSL